jgi:hypothetical protein
MEMAVRIDEKYHAILAFVIGIMVIAIVVGVLFALNVNGILIAAVATMLLLAMISAVNLCVNKDKWSEAPFGLPTGTIRATITLIFIIIVFLGAFNIERIGTIAADMPEWLLGILGTIIGFYFGERKGSAEEAAKSAQELKSKIKSFVDDAQLTPEKKLDAIGKTLTGVE